MSIDGVSVFVEGWGHDADAGHAGDDEENDAADTGFGGEADFFEKVIRGFVQSIFYHMVQDIDYILWFHKAFLGDWVDTIVGQDGRHFGHILACDEGRTLTDIYIDDGIDGSVEESIGME